MLNSMLIELLCSKFDKLQICTVTRIESTRHFSFSPFPALLDTGSDTTSSLPLLSSLDLEDEEDWLKGLQDFISDVTSTGAASSLQSLSGAASLAVNTENGEVKNQKLLR